jgi:hypothetical protein
MTLENNGKHRITMFTLKNKSDKFQTRPFPGPKEAKGKATMHEAMP